jgi:hypothetical protein
MTEHGDMCPNCVTPWKCNGPHEHRNYDGLCYCIEAECECTTTVKYELP